MITAFIPLHLCKNGSVNDCTILYTSNHFDSWACVGLPGTGRINYQRVITISHEADVIYCQRYISLQEYRAIILIYFNLNCLI